MFHVTRASNIDRVLAEGIRPQIGERALALGEKSEAVYAFPTAMDCYAALGQWLGEWFNHAAEEEGQEITLAIIEFDPSGLDQVTSSVGFEAVFSDRVPPSSFRAIHSEDSLERVAYRDKYAAIA